MKKIDLFKHTNGYTLAYYIAVLTTLLDFFFSTSYTLFMKLTQLMKQEPIV